MNIKIKGFFEKPERNYCLRVDGLTINYGKREVLRNVDFTVSKGDLFGIIGLSGSGKSTILKAILKQIKFKGLIDFSKGQSIGFCPQEDAFFHDLSIKENSIIMGSFSRIKYDDIIKRVTHYMMDMELKEPLDKISGNLSGGQRKRLNIILSILNEPNVVILDEPFAGLDYLNRLLLWRFINSLRRKGKTIILTTHLLEEAEEHCNKVLIIKDGKRFALGSINDLKRRFNFMVFSRIKMSYLSKTLFEELIDYAKKNELKILAKIDNELSMGFPDEESYNSFTKLLNKQGKDYRVIELRPPTLNELFLVSIK